MKKRKRNKLIVLLILLLCAGLGTLWWIHARTADAGKASALQTATVIRRDFSSSVLATGAVKPQVGAEVRVGARISGKVEHLYANIGDTVKKGQVIAELEKADLEAAVAKSRAELAMAEARLSSVRALRPREVEKAQAEVRQQRAIVKLAQKEIARQNNLIRQDFTTRQALDQAQERLSVAKARLAAAEKALELARTRLIEDQKQAQAEVARAGAALANAEVKRSYATLTAPISGVVASVSTQAGETVSAGLKAPTFVTIIDLNRLQVDAYVDEVDIGKIHTGQECLFTVDAFPSHEFHGKVIAIYPKAVIQENVVNYDVVIAITDPYHGLLRPEMTASVTIALEKRKKVLAIPAKALQRKRGRNIVYVRSKTGFSPRQVKIGWRDGQWIEIAAGLKEGQAVRLAKPENTGTTHSK